MNEQSVIFVVNLGKNPELKYTKNQKPFCNFSVAVNGENENEPIWERVVVWGKQAELADVQLKKGSKVFVQGRVC
jgi:single-strand DNA-binding protein